MSKSPRRRLPRVTQDEYATIQGQFVHFKSMALLKIATLLKVNPFFINNSLMRILRESFKIHNSQIIILLFLN